MLNRLLLLGVSTLLLVQTIDGHARTFTRCQLAQELQRYTFPRHLLAKWVCTVEYVSGRSTEKFTEFNNGYTSYGLFQISNKEYCKKGRRGGLCAAKCEDFLNDDLADDVKCAKRIFERKGFKSWPSFHHCKDKNLPDLSAC